MEKIKCCMPCVFSKGGIFYIEKSLYAVSPIKINRFDDSLGFFKSVYLYMPYLLCILGYQVSDS